MITTKATVHVYKEFFLSNVTPGRKKTCGMQTRLDPNLARSKCVLAAFFIIRAFILFFFVYCHFEVSESEVTKGNKILLRPG